MNGTRTDIPPRPGAPRSEAVEFIEELARAARLRPTLGGDRELSSRSQRFATLHRLLEQSTLLERIEIARRAFLERYEPWPSQGVNIDTGSDPFLADRPKNAYHPTAPGGVSESRRSPVSGQTDPVVEAYRKDVDCTLLRENLKRTVEERFRNLMELQRFAEELQRAAREGGSDS